MVCIVIEINAKKTKLKYIFFDNYAAKERRIFIKYFITRPKTTGKTYLLLLNKIKSDITSHGILDPNPAVKKSKSRELVGAPIS